MFSKIDNFSDHSMDNYVGRLVEWVYGMPHGIMGHPLQQGHERIAHEIVKRFRD